VQISELLGFLPLALEQAGAYVRETRRSLSAYLDRLRDYPALTMTRGRPPRPRPQGHGGHHPAAVTGAGPFYPRRGRPAGGVRIPWPSGHPPRELFEQRLDPPAADLELLAEDPFALDDAVAALRRFGLVKADEQLLTVHTSAALTSSLSYQVNPEETIVIVSMAAVRLSPTRATQSGVAIAGRLRVRFLLEAGFGGAAAALGVLTLFWRDWIEAIFGVDPDNHSGSLEWLVVAVLLIIAASLGALARADWRRIVAARSPGIDPTSG
jgi:hypothetical protein